MKERHYCGPCNKTTLHSVRGGKLRCEGCGRAKSSPNAFRTQRMAFGRNSLVALGRNSRDH